MEDKIFLPIKVTVRTSHKYIHDAAKELQAKTEYQIGSTKNVKGLKSEILQLKSRTH